MTTDKTVPWLPRLGLVSLGILLIPISSFASFLVGGTYTVITTDAPDDSTQTLTLNNTSQLVDLGNLTVQATTTTDSKDPNSQWIDFNFQTVPGAPLARNPDALWEIQVNDIPLAQPGFFTGFETYWTINGVAAPNIAPLKGYPSPGNNPINSSLGKAYTSTNSPSGAPENSISLFAFIAPFASQLQSGNMDPAAINGFHIGARETPASTSPVPEPSTAALGSLAALGLVFVGMKRGRAAH